MTRVQSSDELTISLYLYGDKLDPSIVSQMVGAPCSECQTKGATKTLRSGKTVVAKTGVWVLKSESKSTNLDQHITELLTPFKHVSTSVVSLIPGIEFALLDVHISAPKLDRAWPDRELRLSNESLARLAVLGFELQLQVIFLD
jgi:Domain of unknown function (DUF4279)